MIENKPVIAIVTPLMKRVHMSWSYASELLFIDSTGNFDTLQHRVLILMAHSFTGALPLGLIITTTEATEALQTGLNLLLKLLGDQAFYGKKAPENIMTDNCASERKALRNIFPDSCLCSVLFIFCKHFGVMFGAMKTVLRRFIKLRFSKCSKKLCIVTLKNVSQKIMSNFPLMILLPTRIPKFESTLRICGLIEPLGFYFFEKT